MEGEKLMNCRLITAAAALLAPMVRPDGYGLEWPASMPEPLGSIMDDRRSRLQWVSDLYATSRQRAEPGVRAA